MNRRDCLRTGAASLLSMGFAARQLRAQGRRPNFLILFTDDQRFSTVHALNNPAVQTPNMDRLLARGTAFTHCFIQGSLQGAVCVCSRSCLMTGRTLYHSPQQLRADDQLALFPATFREAGYETFGTGKWHNGVWSYAQCFSSGGNIFFGGMSDHLKVPVNPYDPDGKYPKERRHIGEKFSSELFSDSAVDFLEHHDPAKPYLAYASYTAPHDPRMAPEEYKAMYPPDKVTVPPNFMPEHPFDNGEMRIRDEALAPWPRTPEIVQEHLAAYYAMITEVDDQIGRVLDALSASGMADDTYILFAGDNGLAVGQHGLMGKQNLYEHSVRVPLVVCGPGIPAGEKCDSLVYLHDLFPTACELADLPVPATVEGRSLARQARGSRRPVYASVFAGYKDVQRMVRDDRWKLIRYPKVGEVQLFDLDHDPWELHDLAETPAQAERVKALDAELLEWQQRLDDPLLSTPPDPPRMPITPDADGAFILEPGTAKLSGGLCYQPDKGNIGCWTNVEDHPSWWLAGVKASRYRVIFSYGTANPGATYTVTIGEAKLDATTEATGGLLSYQEFELGTVTLLAGELTVTIQPHKLAGGAFANFRELRIEPV